MKKNKQEITINISAASIWKIIGIIILIFLSVIVDILTGPAMLSIKQVISTIFNLESTNVAQNVIIWDMRIPMAIMAIIVGRG